MINQKVCRVCLRNSDQLKSLQANLLSKNKIIVDAINFVANINIKLETGLPDKICRDCETNLDSADGFKQRCLESETLLDQQYMVIKKEDRCELTSFFEKKELSDQKYIKGIPCSTNSAINLPQNLTETCKNEDNQSGYVPNYKVKTEIEIQKINEQSNNDDISDGDKEISHKTQNIKKTKLKSEKLEIKIKNVTNTDIEIVYSCTDCDKTFTKKISYAAHMYRHHNPKNFGRFVCSVCKKVFASNYNFKKHLRTHKPKVKGIITERFPCKTCQQEFKFKSNLKKHLRSGQCHQYKCFYKDCERKFPTRESLDAHKAEHVKDQNKQVCPICGVTLKCNAQSLLTHMRRHQNIKAFQCDECDKNFVTKQELKVHKRTHTSARPFLCPECGRGFTTSTCLRTHRAAKHSDARPHSCDLCDKTFKTLGSLRAHRPVHLGEKPHSCPVCGRAFLRNFAVLKHLKTHARDTPRIDEMIAQMRKYPGAKPKLARPENETQQTQTEA